MITPPTTPTDPTTHKPKKSPLPIPVNADVIVRPSQDRKSTRLNSSH